MIYITIATFVQMGTGIFVSHATAQVEDVSIGSVLDIQLGRNGNNLCLQENYREIQKGHIC